jgi:hypothetical protein
MASSYFFVVRLPAEGEERTSSASSCRHEGAASASESQAIASPKADKATVASLQTVPATQTSLPTAGASK